jgi:hypothetical protein
VENAKSREVIGLLILVALIGIEPISRVPETPILSIELQSLNWGKDNPII